MEGVIVSSFNYWWQHLPEHMNPVVFSIGSFSLQYYGLMYLVAFVVVYLLASWRLKTEHEFKLKNEDLQGLMTAMILGVILGGRLGYVVFYNFAYYMAHPLEIVLPFDVSDGFRFTGISGMSFHGGLIGVILAIWIFGRRHKTDFFLLTDLIGPCVPLGYTFGRLGNFINGELYGRVTASSIGMYFPAAPGESLRHPSQLYEAFFEGIFLFAVLWFLKGRVRLRGAMLALYLAGYGLVRFFIEYTRQPDDHLGFVLPGLTMGQLLCLAMIISGLLFLIVLRRLESRREAKKKAASKPRRRPT
jgi:phosphatidylglycerol:prolipoprotein diacylglycerol transferase